MFVKMWKNGCSGMQTMKLYLDLEVPNRLLYFAPKVTVHHGMPSALTWKSQVIAGSEVGLKASFCQYFVSDEKHSHFVGG